MKFKITRKMKLDLCRQAPEFTDILRNAGIHSFECSGDLFPALVRSIISQQLAIRAADAIHRRVEQLLGSITPERLKQVDQKDLRRCGLSQRKIDSITGAADAVLSGKKNFRKIAELPDNEIIQELISLKGVGVWTAEMLLIFALGRPDVLSFSDLGIRRGIMALNHLDSLSRNDFEFYRKRYSPYGTLASLCLWKIKDGGLDIGKNPDAVKGKKASSPPPDQGKKLRHVKTKCEKKDSSSSSSPGKKKTSRNGSKSSSGSSPQK